MLAWSLTYLVHSTLLIGAVWLISRRLADRPLALDRLWKLALVGGVITATVQTAAGLSPAALQLGSSHEGAVVAAHKPVAVRWHFDFPRAAQPQTAPDEDRTPGTGSREQGTGDESVAVGSLTAPSESVTPPQSGSVSESRSESEASSVSAVEAWKWVLLLAGV